MTLIKILYLVTFFCTFLFGQNSIDALTSASGDIRIDSGYAYSDHAYLYTYHKDSYLTHVVTLGFDTVSHDTLIRPNSPRTNICTLTTLLPDTLYYYSFAGGLATNWNAENHFVSGTFRTDSPTALISNSLSNNQKFSVSALGKNLLLRGALQSGDSFLIVDLKGRLLSSFTMQNSIQKIFTLPNLAHGIVTVIIKRENSTLLRQSIFISTKSF